MSEETGDVTLDDVELLVWRVLGAKDAGTVDTVLKAVQAYAERYAVHIYWPRQYGRTEMMRKLREGHASAMPHYVAEADGSLRPLVLPSPAEGSLAEDPACVDLPLPEPAPEGGFREPKLFPYVFGGCRELRGEGDSESLGKSMLFEGGGSESVEKSMLFSAGKGGSPSFSTENADTSTGEDADGFLAMLAAVVGEGRESGGTEDPGDGSRQCTTCGTWRAEGQYALDRTKKSGRRSRCKPCTRDADQRRRGTR